jgi:hypothetical protein
MRFTRHLALHRLRLRLKSAGIAIALSALPVAWQLALAQPRSSHSNPDWPCRQILVSRMSLAAVWSGPPIEGLAWRDDRRIAGAVAQLAARRTSMEDADHLIEEAASSGGSGKTKALLAIFAGLFETLNDERTQVIEGLLRSGAKQRELAAKIRTEASLPQERSAGEMSDTARRETGTGASELDWDLRIFENRRQSISFVCETPAIIEQRLYALAKLIERKLE